MFPVRRVVQRRGVVAARLVFVRLVVEGIEPGVSRALQRVGGHEDVGSAFPGVGERRHTHPSGELLPHAVHIAEGVADVVEQLSDAALVTVGHEAPVLQRLATDLDHISFLPETSAIDHVDEFVALGVDESRVVVAAVIGHGLVVIESTQTYNGQCEKRFEREFLHLLPTLFII